MFTGIVEDLGTVVDLTRHADAAQLTIGTALGVDGVGLGGSIAVNGCCLTVAERGADWFRADLMAETLARTSLGQVAAGDGVNIERALPADGRLAGHVVQGHVDGTGVLLDRRHGSRWDVIRVGVPTGLVRYLAPKGSVALDGVSLTVVDVVDAINTVDVVDAISTVDVVDAINTVDVVDAINTVEVVDAVEGDEAESAFTVSLIPETLARTTLGTAQTGAVLNVEVDVLAKYVERMLRWNTSTGTGREVRS